MALGRLKELWARYRGPAKRLLLLLVPLLFYMPGLTGFPYPNQAAGFSDLAITHYPYGLYLQRSVLEGRLPLWFPGILSGVPLFANPLSGMWYVPGWLALLLPLPLGFNLLVLAHLLWGGVGMYCLLRAEGLAEPGALWGAVAFVGLPKLAAHYGAGHLTLLYAVPWTPWLLYLADRGGQANQRPVRAAAGGLSALVLALIFLADVRWCALAGLIWAAYSLYHQPTRQRVFRIVGGSALAALLAAPLAVPLLELVGYTTRRDLGLQDRLAFSLPPARLLGLLFPDFGGFHEYMLYSGQVVLLLTCLALAGGWLKRPGWFWCLAGAGALLWSLGEALPPLAALARLPGLDLLRVPARALFILGMALSVLSAYSVSHLSRGLIVGRGARLVIAGVAAFSLVLAAGVVLISGELPLPFAWGAALAAASLVWISLRLAGRIPNATWLVGLFFLGLVDWFGTGRTLFVRRPAEQVLGEAAAVTEYLAAQDGPFRTYSPSYSLPQPAAAFYRLQLSDGVDPLQLSSYVRYMEAATGVPWSGYSVTLPPYSTGDPLVDNAAYRPYLAGLGLLNVAYVAAEYDLPIPGLDLVQQFGRTRLYANPRALPRAWVQPEGAPAGQEIWPVEGLDWTPEQIVIHATGPGLLVLSELMYPGWQVQVDGMPAPLESVAGLLRGVVLPPGTHLVRFQFRPLSLVLGLSLGLLGCIIWVRLWMKTGLSIAESQE